MKDVESIIQSIITQSFVNLKSIETGLFILELFYHLHSKESIQRALDKAGMEIISKINSEIEIIDINIDSKNQFYNFSDMPYGPFEIIFLNNLNSKLDSLYSFIVKTPFLCSTGQACETKTYYESVKNKISTLINEKKTSIAQEITNVPLDSLDTPIIRINLKEFYFEPRFNKYVSLNFNL